MKILLLLVVAVVLAVDGFVPSKDRHSARSLASAKRDVLHFLHAAMSVAGKGCKAITKYVTGPVCNAISIVPAGIETALCGFSLQFYGVCVGTVEGTRTYCATLGSSGGPGGPALDSIVCAAVQRHGKK